MWRYIFFWVLLLSALLSWGAWLVVVYFISPFESPQFAFPAFYSSLLFAFISTYTLLSTLIRKMITPTKSSFLCLQIALRHGAGFGALALCGVLYQQLSDVGLRLEEVVFVLVCFLIIEVFFIIRSGMSK